MNQSVMEAILAMNRKKGLLFRHVTPEYLTVVAYNMHTAADATRAGSPAAELARRVWDSFKSLRAEPGTKHYTYLTKVWAELVSLANATGNLKKEFLQEIAEINRIYAAEKKKILVEILIAAAWTLVYRGLMLTGFGAVGLIIARSVAPLVPDQIAISTGDRAPQIMGVALMAFFAFLVSRSWNEYRRYVRENDSKQHRRIAWKRYNLERRRAIIEHLEKFHRYWFEYTEVAFWIPVEASYAAFIKDEMDMLEQLEKELAERPASPIVLFLQKVVRRLFRRKSKTAAFALREL